MVWEETGCCFIATIVGEYEPDALNSGIKYFDILYDEVVSGKIVTEKHVNISRLSHDVSPELLSDTAYELEMQSTCGGRYLHATSGKDLLAKLISIKEDEDELDDYDDNDYNNVDDDYDDVMEPVVDGNGNNMEIEDRPLQLPLPIPTIKLELSSQQIIMINEALHLEQIHSLIHTSKRTLHFITEQLLLCLKETTSASASSAGDGNNNDNDNENDIPDFELSYNTWLENNDDNNDDGDTALWLAPGQDGGKLITKCRSILAATAALSRILSCHVPGLDVTVVDEVVIETALRWVYCIKSL